MSAPVAMIPYANMAPYRQLGAPRDCNFVPLVPKASIGALIDGKVAAAAVPVGGLARLAGIVETVGRFGIAAKGASMSVLLFSRYPIEHMHEPKTLHAHNRYHLYICETYHIYHLLPFLNRFRPSHQNIASMGSKHDL